MTDAQRFRLLASYRTPRIRTVVLRHPARIELHVRPESTAREREELLRQWYRQHLKTLIPPLIDKWQSVLNVEVAEWGIKRMKTRWGSCNARARRIWVNLELAKKPARCLEYIVVHELAHLLERRHNDRFMAILNRAMPQWRSIRQELDAAPLAHENRTY